MRKLLSCLAIAYPFLVYLGLQRGYYQAILLLLAMMAGVKIFTIAPATFLVPKSLLAALAALTVVALGSVSSRFPLLAPSVINLLLCLTFVVSLMYPPNVIERIATKREGALPLHAKRYCHKVCLVWIVFFIANGVIAFDSVFRSLEWWSLYNGFLSYCAIAVVFGIELLCRRVVKRSAAAQGLSLLIVIVCAPLFACTPLASRCAAANTAALSLEDIRTSLTPHGAFRSTFSEKRFIAVLSRPLESHGEIRCIPAKGIIWNVISPIAQTNIITPHALVRLDSKLASSKTVDSSQVSTTLLSLLSGDIDTVNGSFSVTVKGTKDAWEVTLTPQDSLTRAVIAGITISGSGRPRTIKVSHASGDTIVTTFSEPIPLSPEEMKRAEETLHVAL